MIKMARKVFFSFDYDDVWRVNVVRNSDVTKKSAEVAGFIDKAKFEEVKKKGADAIRKWIDQQMEGTSVTVVLIGANTSESEWVKYEIKKSIDRGNGLMGVYIHNIEDEHGKTGVKGQDPFAMLGYNKEIKTYDWINDKGYDNFGHWIEAAYQQAQLRKNRPIC